MESICRKHTLTKHQDSKDLLQLPRDLDTPPPSVGSRSPERPAVAPTTAPSLPSTSNSGLLPGDGFAIKHSDWSLVYHYAYSLPPDYVETAAPRSPGSDEPYSCNHRPPESIYRDGAWHGPDGYVYAPDGHTYAPRGLLHAIYRQLDAQRGPEGASSGPSTIESTARWITPMSHRKRRTNRLRDEMDALHSDQAEGATDQLESSPRKRPQGLTKPRLPPSLATLPDTASPVASATAASGRSSGSPFKMPPIGVFPAPRIVSCNDTPFITGPDCPALQYQTQPRSSSPHKRPRPPAPKRPRPPAQNFSRPLPEPPRFYDPRPPSPDSIVSTEPLPVQHDTNRAGSHSSDHDAASEATDHAAAEILLSLGDLPPLDPEGSKL